MSLVVPEATIAVGDKTFTLVGSFGTLKAIQHAFKKDILDVQATVMTMRQDEIAKLIAIAVAASSHSLTAPTDHEIGQLILDEMDIADAGYIGMKADIMAWLYIAMSPKREREKKSAEMAETVNRIKNALSSPGMNTSASQPASSDGV